MYHSQFGLCRRPFSSTPDSNCVVPVGGMPEAMSELEHCAQDGQGLGILTAPAGLGKTVLCRKLAESLRDQFAVVFLPNANFPTRRSLLQAMLYEMGHPYLRLGEQELRLEFTTAVRDLQPDRDGVVVIVDEAHLLHNRLLEELRTATHLVHQGEMLVRVILSGQLDLEERLVKKDLAAINQRIVCHVTLSSLTMLESQEYLAQRIEWAGGTLSEIFTDDSVRMICQASDGNARCLNQLADHALLLATACKHPKVETSHVLDALEELKQLPLHWNHVEVSKPTSGGSPSIVEIVPESSTNSIEDHEEPETACIEFGAPLEEEQTGADAGLESGELETAFTEYEERCIEVHSEELLEEAPECETDDTAEEALALTEIEEETIEEDFVDVSATVEPMDTVDTMPDASGIWSESAHDFVEEAVKDHYAQLDNGVVPEIVQQQPRDWENWDPVQELRDEEATFAAPPFPQEESEITIINAIPEPGEEWQPEDLNLPKNTKTTPDPSELIDRVMPLIDAALQSDFSELDGVAAVDLQASFLKDLESTAPTPVSDPVSDPFLAEASLAGDWDHKDELDEIALLMNQPLPINIGSVSEESHEYVTLLQNVSSSQDIEEQIAQTVLDTYNDLQPLLWNSTTETEATVEPPPVDPGEEPIRDPGDSTPFNELRETLQQAIEATNQPVGEEDSEPPTPVIEEPTAKSNSMPVEYDIVLPEEESDTRSLLPPSDAPVSGPQRPHSTRNLFSRLRRKEQA